MAKMRCLALMVCAAFLLGAVPVFAAPPAPGSDAPEFELPILGGGNFKLSEMKGKKAVVLAFTQSACGSCRAELQYLSGLEKSDNFEIFQVNVDVQGGTDRWNGLMSKIIEREGWTMKILVDPKYTVGPKFGILATPATAVISKDGKLLGTLVGYNPEDLGTMQALIDKVK